MYELIKNHHHVVRAFSRGICLANLKTIKPSKVRCTRTIANDSISMNENEFSNELLKNHIELTSFQKLILITGSSVASLLDPRRHDMIACLGETTGEAAILQILQTMNRTDEGRRILQQKPRINTGTIDIDNLRKLPDTTLGHAYVQFLDSNKVTPDSRMPVRFIKDESLAYLMTRYRECHDLVHTILGMPTDMLGEVAVKWVEALNNGLPMCYAGAIFGAIRLLPQQRIRYVTQYLPWATRNGTNAKPLMNVYWEERWQQNLQELREELNITTLEP